MKSGFFFVYLMAKEEFTFKQFLIRQDQCAMKVCTDACILGASIPVNNEINEILDIGSGTGLLSLMLAQRSSAKIDAVEINTPAALQSRTNILSSPWPEKIQVYNLPIQEFGKNTTKRYDLIVTNPPFYKNNLHSDNIEFNIACHSEFLSFEEILIAIERLLKLKGIFVVMLPEYESLVFRNNACKYNFQNYACIDIRHFETSKILRKINFFKIQDGSHDFKTQEIIIKNKAGNYTLSFQELLTPYYTIFKN